ncbi:hypothetical protein AB0N81_05350 [Streptomyces sp. NPDC093510]|uniref:hypothetical protein n=1 Tax=Streptomyces sp. NPDC093510 TaxID=3155199 RepID=UPI0034343009
MDAKTSRSPITESTAPAPAPSPAPAAAATLSAWFAHSRLASEQACREWAESGVALLPLGGRFDAVRLPEALVQAALGVIARQAVAARLAWLVEGPVVYDGRTLGGSYYALMKPCRSRVWKHQDCAPRLSRGTYLGVPRLDRTEPPGPYWIVRPRFAGDLCEPATVAAVIGLGQSTDGGDPVASASASVSTARRRVELVYQSYLAHLDHCAPCQTETGPCADGERMRRALRAVRRADSGADTF